MRNSSTSNLPLYSTTVSKICSIRCESIRWPSASTTSCCMGIFQDTGSRGDERCKWLKEVEKQFLETGECFLPPGPELDPKIAGQPLRQDVDDSALSAIDLGFACHFR